MKPNHNCAICAKQFHSSQYLKQHINSVHLGIKFACEVCGNKFVGKQAKEDHVKAFHRNDPSFKCNICMKALSSRVILREHMDAIHKKLTPYQCKFCHLKFSRRNTLKSHEANVHRDLLSKDGRMKAFYTDDSKFKCHICSRILQSQYNLNAHIAVIHEKLRLFKCDFCDLKFSSRKYRKLHMGKAHRDLLPEDQHAKTLCDHCAKDFCNADYLKRHIDVAHLGLKRFQCRFCGQKFGLKTSRVYHEKRKCSQAKIMPSARHFPCEECKLEFKSKKGLQIHNEDIHDDNDNNESNPPRFLLNQNLLAQDPYQKKLVVPLKAMFQ